MNPFFDKRYGIKSKNVGPFLAFGGEWFAKYQDWLLFLLNAPILRLWTRWIFRMDTKYRDIIVQVEPNNYKILLPDGQIRGDFRTHPKFSKRVYFAFRWWWWCLHYIDEWVKVPQLSFGFDTLTAYPDPNPETNTTDGGVYRSGVNETFANIITGSGTLVIDTGNDFNLLYLQGSTTTNQFQLNGRGIFLFNTSSIGASSTISNGTLSLCSISGATKASILGKSDVCIISSSPASNTNIVTGDYGNFGTTIFASKSFDDYTETDLTYNDFTLNESGLAAISQTSISKFGSKSKWDYDATFGGGWNNNAITRINAIQADYTGTDYDPKLVVTYSTSSIKTISGVAIASVKTASGLAKASIKKIVGLA